MTVESNPGVDETEPGKLLYPGRALAMVALGCASIGIAVLLVTNPAVADAAFSAALYVARAVLAVILVALSLGAILAWMAATNAVAEGRNDAARLWLCLALAVTGVSVAAWHDWYVGLM
jgi:hypothetical protein